MCVCEFYMFGWQRERMKVVVEGERRRKRKERWVAFILAFFLLLIRYIYVYVGDMVAQGMKNMGFPSFFGFLILINFNLDF